MMAVDKLQAFKAGSTREKLEKQIRLLACCHLAAASGFEFQIGTTKLCSIIHLLLKVIDLNSVV
jgi:hypothetical protein